MSKSSVQLRKMILTALFLACGLLLPSLFHALGAGTVFLPLHLMVLVCGFVCGWQWGLLCGAVLPLLSSALTGMPPLYPVALAMMCELAAYGALTGCLSRLLRKRKAGIYIALIGAMLGGRIISGLANSVLYGISGTPYGLQTFLAAAFVTSLPGIVIQLLLVPPLVLAIRRLLAQPRLQGSGLYEK